jgi:PAS domain S-box-containing protein
MQPFPAIHPHQKEKTWKARKGHPGALGGGEEVAGRKQAEEQLRRSESLYRLLADNASDVIWTLGMDMRLTYISPSVTKLLGFTVEEAMTMPGDRAYTPASFEKIAHFVAAAMEIDGIGCPETDRLRTVELDMVHRDGGIVPVECNFSFLYDEGNRMTGILAIVRDIADRKRMEAEKERLEAVNRQLRKVESLGRMVGAIAHTFNNQLTAIIGSLELARDELPPGSGAADKVNSALQAAGKAAGVTGQMLIYLGHSFEKRGRLDLSAFFRAAVPAFRASLPDNVTLETEIPSVLPAITANPAEL